MVWPRNLYPGKGPGGTAGTGIVATEYVGADTRSACHTEIAEVFDKSGHAYKLNNAIDAHPPPPMYVDSYKRA